MVDEKDFMKQNFKTYGIVELKAEKALYKVPVNWQPMNGNLDLRTKIRNIVWEKTDEYRAKHNVKMSDYYIVELCCRIPSDTIKKAISGRYNITRRFLAKFTVGFHLDIETANSLFRAHSGELNHTNDFDFIVYHALKTKDSIDFFIVEVEKYTGINLDRDK